MKKVLNFKLTPEWVLNNLPQSFQIIGEEIIIRTEIELDFKLIKQALQTLRVLYFENKYSLQGNTIFWVKLPSEVISHVLPQQLSELKNTEMIVRRGFVSHPETWYIFPALLMLSISLERKVSMINNEFHQIDDVLSSLSELVEYRCNFILNSDGKFCCYENKQNEKPLGSDERILLFWLGTFACFQINLGYLELKNPMFKGLNDSLSAAFPEVYDAYISLSKKNSFTGTARLMKDKYISVERIQKYFQNPGIVEWDSDLLELDENYLEEEEVKQSTSNVNERNGFLPPIQKQKSLNSKAESHSFSVN